METTSGVCRTCLQQIDYNCPRFHIDFVESPEDLMPLRQKLHAFFPEMNLNLFSNPMLCNDCFCAIKSFYKFKEKCRETEARIQKYLQGNSPTLISADLQEVVVNEQKQFSFIENNFDDKKCSINTGKTIKKLEMIRTESVKFNHFVKNYVVDQTEAFNPDLFEKEEKHVSRDNTSTKIKAEGNTIKTRNSETSKRDKPYKCPDCKFSCHTKGNLKMHMLIHTGDKPYKCTDCNYQSVQKHHLVVHMRRHTDEKPYKCTECSYSCRQPTNLQAHMYRHPH